MMGTARFFFFFFALLTALGCYGGGGEGTRGKWHERGSWTIAAEWILFAFIVLWVVVVRALCVRGIHDAPRCVARVTKVWRGGEVATPAIYAAGGGEGGEGRRSTRQFMR